MRPQALRHGHPDWLPKYLRASWLLPDDHRLFFAVESGRLGYALAALRGAGWRAESKTAHGYGLIIADPPQAPPAAQGQKLTLLPQGDGLVADLGAGRKLAQVELLPPQGQTLTPAGLRLELSRDGAAFTPATFQARWPSRLYWSGLAPMAAMPGPVRLELAPTTARYLRLSRREAPLPAGLALSVIPVGK